MHVCEKEGGGGGVCEREKEVVVVSACDVCVCDVCARDVCTYRYIHLYVHMCGGQGLVPGIVLWSRFTFCTETLLSLESDWESSVSPLDLSSLGPASHCSLC